MMSIILLLVEVDVFVTSKEIGNDTYSEVVVEPWGLRGVVRDESKHGIGNVQEESSLVERKRDLVTNDPCLGYFDPLTKLLCETCDNTYELFIISPTIVHCASY